MSPERELQLKLEDGDLFDTLLQVCRSVQGAGGRAWLVGGSVRDTAVLGVARDLDLEVFGLAPQELIATLEGEFDLDLVGKSFGILKLKGAPIDVGLPRRETKIGEGHRGFVVSADPSMTVAEAAARRDFTMNAIYLDPLTGEVEDPFDGVEDLQRGILRHTSPAFREDPLRVLRAMQLAARFDLEVAPETVAECRSIGREGLPPERIFGEWAKLITLGERPSRGLLFLRDCDWLRYYPELSALIDVPQDVHWHPEGDVWTHTLHCLDAFAAEKTGEYWEDLVVGLAVLCHDMGKPETTEEQDGRIRSCNHNQVGVEKTRSFLGAMTSQARLLQEVEVLVAEHPYPSALFETNASDAAVRRLAVRVGRIDRLVRVARADVFGRPPLPDDTFPAGDWLLEKAEMLQVADAKPEPLVLGRHLVAMGLKPGPFFGQILDDCYEAQLAGDFATEKAGIAHAARLVADRENGDD